MTENGTPPRGFMANSPNIPSEASNLSCLKNISCLRTDFWQMVYKEKGQLKAMLAVEAELNSFETEPAEDLAAFPELKRLQEIYRVQLETQEKAIVEPKQKLIAHYQSLTGALAAAWTREGKIEEAKN